MMINPVRMSRRAMFGGIILCVFFVIGLMVVKDMNNKLSVMTYSNSGYQKMTDSQANAGAWVALLGCQNLQLSSQCPPQTPFARGD